MPASSRNASLPFRASSGLAEWLGETESSLALTVRSDHSLAFISPGDDGSVRGVACRFECPTSLHVTPDRLLLATDHQVHELVDALKGGGTYEEYDRVYIPRHTHTTGAIGVRDLFQTDGGETHFVSTRYGTLAALSDVHSFRPVWQPWFAPNLRPDTVSRLTGVAPGRKGQARFATGVRLKSDGQLEQDVTLVSGVVVEVDSGSLVAEGLVVPLAPRLDGDTLYFLTAGDGKLRYLDPASGTVEIVASVSGYPCGLALHAGYAVVVTSPAPRELIAEIPVLKGAQTAPARGQPELHVIDLDTGRTIADANVGTENTEVGDVHVLPDTRHPTALGLSADLVRRTVVFETSEGAVYHRLTSGSSTPQRGNRRSAPPPSPGAESSNPISVSELDLLDAKEQGTRIAGNQAYNFYTGRMRAGDVAQRFSSLLPKRFIRRLRVGAVDASTPLIGVAATLGEQPIGIAAAAASTDADVATLHALKVLASHRGQGLGTELLERLEYLAEEAGAEVLQGSFRSSISSLAALERVLEKREWEPPKVKRYLYRGERSAVPDLFVQRLARNPAKGTLFKWEDLTDEERCNLQARLDPSADRPIPTALNPFQMQSRVEPSCSVGLRHEGRVAGWMITHRLSPDVLQYTCLYVEPEVRGPGVGPRLLAETIRRHAKRTEIPRFIWMVDVDKTRMHRFLDRRLGEVIDDRDKQLLAGKRLSS